MRLRTALLSAALVGCSSGVTTPNAVVYGTRLSANSASMGDSVAVTLTIANPAPAPVHLAYGAPFTFARFTRNDATLTTVSPTLAADTITLAAGADTALATIMVHLSTFPLHPLSNAEVVGIQSGTYNVAACGWVPAGSSAKASCGPTVQFTVTP